MPSPRTLLGPLTTSWSPPSICTIAMAVCNTCTTLWQGQSCNPQRRAHDWTECWPPRTSGVADPGVMMGWGFYSPAYSCPDGYSTAGLATAAGSSDWSVGYSMDSDETAIACCPTGYSISSVVATGTTGQTCVTIATITTSLSTVQCISGSFVNFNSATIPNSDAPGIYTLFAPLFQLNYRAQDRTATSSGASAPGSTPGSPQPSETSPTDPGSGGGNDSGLSLGAKVGIGIGSAMLAIFLGIMIFLITRMLRRRRAPRPIGEPLPGEGKAIPREPELGGTEVRELEASEKPRELGTDAPGSSGKYPAAVGSPTVRKQDGGPDGGRGSSHGGEEHVFELEGSSPVESNPRT